MTSMILAAVGLAGVLAAPSGARASSHDDVKTTGDNARIVIGRPVKVSPTLADRGVTRATTITLPADLFRSTTDDPVRIEIEAGRFIELVEQKRRIIGDITYVVGTDQLTPHSRFIFQLKNNAPHRAEIRLFNEVISLVGPQRNNGNVIFQMLTIDPTLISLEEDPLEPAIPWLDSGADNESGSSGVPPPSALTYLGALESFVPPVGVAVAPTEVSILVVYTPAAKTAVEIAFNPLTIEEVITDQVVWTNFGLEDQADVTLTLVKVAPIPYLETNSIAEDISRLECPCDHKKSYVGSNNLNEVFGLWKEWDADIVSLWIHSPTNPPQSGIANVLPALSTDWAPRAVSVVDWRAATGRLSFDHEIAHNFGARHDWAQDTTDNRPYTFNHGYINVPNKQGTIMAYESTCLLLGYWCSRTVYWSDPTLPPADSMGVSIGMFLAAYNAHALRLSAPIVAGFDSKHDDLLGCCINVGTFWNQEWRPGPCP